MLPCWDNFAQNEEKTLLVGDAHPSRPLDPALIMTEHMFGVFIRPHILGPWMCHRRELSESVNSSVHKERLKNYTVDDTANYRQLVVIFWEGILPSTA